jgi:anti-sigma regulatory factor (Ser/Thr protein kinase)
MASLLDTERGPRRILLLDADLVSCAPLSAELEQLGTLVACPAPEIFLPLLEEDPDAIGLVDTATLAGLPHSFVADLVALRGKRHLALVTGQQLEDFIFSLRSWGLLQCAVKAPPFDRSELEHFLLSVVDPTSGFGLLRYLGSTIQMYSIALQTADSKLRAIERVTNHFATCGFEVHELYDVRLILEEVTNNALFHAFQTATGRERHNISSFAGLDPGESVRIEYGSDDTRVGFAVTDNAGTLPIRTILSKLERQFNKDGIFDQSGRGLYLSRMLTTKLVINIEKGKRTQVVALFDEHRKSPRPKPFLVNYAGPDTFDEWGADPEFDLG